MEAVDLKAKTSDELKQELFSLLLERFNLCFLSQEQVKLHDFSRIKKDIARIKGVLRERDVFL